MTRDDVLDAALAVVAVGLHLGAAAYLDRLPPRGAFELVLVGLPVLAGVAAVLALVVRSDRRVLQGVCVLQWLLVLFTLPAFGLGLAFAPSAVVLTVAALRPRLSSDRAAAG